MEGLTASQLAARAGVEEEDVERLVRLRILVPRDGAAPFLPTDVRRISLARACEAAGLPLEGIGAAIEEGRLSFAFLEAGQYERLAARSDRTYEQVCREAKMPFEALRNVLQAMGFGGIRRDDRMREDELEIVPVLQLAISTTLVDEPQMVRAARAYAEALRRITRTESDFYHSVIEVPLLQSGQDERSTMELASQLGESFTPLLDRALMAMYRRHQELSWTEHLVEHIEQALDEAGLYRRPKRVSAMCFLDLAGYTKLTEERGDQAAAELAESLAGLVHRSSRDHGGMPVKWLGDGVMFHFPEPSGAVTSALRMVEEVPRAGLPPAHLGVAAGPVVAQAGDYFGRTVNVAARIAAVATAGQVLVEETVVETAAHPDAEFVELGPMELKGLTRPVRLFEARRA